MKHFFTNEKELTMFVNAFPEFNLPAMFAEETQSRFLHQPQSRSKPAADLPDAQIISNILNYARALDVLKPATGATMFLIKN